MNGVLSFLIGAEAGPFIKSVHKAQEASVEFGRRILDLTGVAGLFATAIGGLEGSVNLVEGVFAAFERGAELEKMSKRTGESVKDLFMLQKGLQGAGVEADGLSGLIFHLDKALGGITETGESTADVFGLLHLNMSQMRGMGATDQFTKIAAAMKDMGQSQRVAIAEKLFGREGAQNFLQLAGNAREFAAAMQAAGPAAEQMARNGAAFEKIEKSMAQIKSKSQNLFAGIAEGAAPGIQKILDMLNKIDLSGIGKNLGSVFAGFAGAIKEGKLAEALAFTVESGLKAGFYGAIQYAIAQFAKLGTWLFRLFQSVTDVLDTAFDRMAHPTETLEEAYTHAHAASEARRKERLGAIPQVEKQAVGDAAQIWEVFIARMKAFGAALPPSAPPAEDPKGKGAGQSVFDRKPFEGTHLEKMGFHFGAGGPTILRDHAAATSTATRETATNTRRILDLLVTGHQYGGGDWMSALLGGLKNRTI